MARSTRLSFRWSALPALALVPVLGSAPAMAATLTWPGSAPCDTTLQACVDAAAINDVVQIGSGAGEITTTLGIAKPITLRSAPLARGRFRNATLFLNANFSGPGNRYVIEGIQFIDAPIDLTLGTNDAADEQTVVLRGLDISSEASFDPAIRVRTLQLSSQKLLQVQHLRFIGRTAIGNQGAPPVFDLEVEDSQFTLTGASGGVALVAAGASDVAIRRNRFENRSGNSDVCVNLQGIAGSSLQADIARNLTVGCPTGIRLVAQTGATGFVARVRNNTLRQHRWAFQLAGEPLAGEIDNNIVSEIGAVVFDQTLSTFAARNNLYHRTPAIPQDQEFPTFANPRFVSSVDEHLQPDSPAVNSGRLASIPPGGDLDGHRNDFDTVGAFDFRTGGSDVHVATPQNSFSNVTEIPQSLAPSFAAVNVQSLVGGFPLPAWAPNHLGIYATSVSPQQSFLFSQNQGSIGTPRAFNVLYSTLYQGRTDVATAANQSANLMVIDWSELNGRPAARPIVMQRALQTGGVINDRAVGVWYDAGRSRWTIFNQDQSPMLLGARFDVILPPAGAPFAFVAEALPSAALDVVLEHPLLDNQPCATVFATPVYTGTYLTSAIHARYRATTNGGGRWTLIRGDGGLFQNGMDFHVTVEPARARSCQADGVFGDGLE